jgi:hypothetical protein
MAIVSTMVECRANTWAVRGVQREARLCPPRRHLQASCANKQCLVGQPVRMERYQNMSKASVLLVVAVLFLGVVQFASAQHSDAAQIGVVEAQVAQLRSEVNAFENNVQSIQASVRNEAAGSGVAVFLFGVVCALWAQNSGRNPWLWFFLGLCFNVITGLVLLSKNSQDRKMQPKGTEEGEDGTSHRHVSRIPLPP